MNLWKWAFGLGLACAVCCALPLAAGGAAMLAFGAALWRYFGEAGPLAAVGLGAIGLIGLGWWKVRQARLRRACGCGTICAVEGACADG